MQLIDWLFVFIPLAVVFALAAYTRRYLRSVADFMAGGRLAGRYLLSTAFSEMGAGAVAYISLFEMFGHGGFSIGWWGQISGPVVLIFAISGFVIYRYRQTRALTLAQFFEMRYSRRFRLFTGVLAVFSGLLNFGIMPVIGAKFMVYFLEFPQIVHIFSLQVPTYLLVMGCFLTICTLLTISGGQLTVILTDCVQGMFSQIFYVIIIVAVLISFNWSHTTEMLLARPPGQSLVNPFDSFSTKDFNIWYVLMGLFGGVYGTMAWQNRHGFNSAALTAHESRMGGILGQWRGFALALLMIVLAVASMTYLSQPAGDTSVRQSLSRISDPQTAEQMRLAIGVSQILPVGIKGLLVAVMIMGIFGGDGMHLHSWSSIFVQDIIMPLRKHPLGTRQHLILLRCAVVGVALFAFCFGALFKQTEYVAMWFQVTMAIYVGGAGACIIGGLYWSRGTTAGAWTGLLTGSVLATGGILLRQPDCPAVLQAVAGHLGLGSVNVFLLQHLGRSFPLNGTEISFYSALLAIGSYVAVSLVTCRTPHNMDQLLHRGRYAVEPEAPGESIVDSAKPARGRFHIYNLVGIDEHFTRSDRWVSIGIFLWGILWCLVFVIGSAWYLVRPWSNTAWLDFWLVKVLLLPLIITLVTTVWFTIGCWNDMMAFFRRLRTERIDPKDDGRVERAPAEKTGEFATKTPINS